MTSNALRDDTDSLLKQAQDGDVSAASRLLVRHRAKLLRMVKYRMDDRLRGRFDPSDVVQETFIIAATRMDDYLVLTPVAFYPWLRSIAWRRLIDLYRRHVRADRRSVDREFHGALTDQSATHLTDRLATPHLGPSESVERKELQRRVRQALSQLGADAREVLMLRFVEQLSAREASQVIGITEAALKGRQVRALEKLRHLLDCNEGGTC